MSDPLVSIIITNYNYAYYLPECIESCLNQTYKNIQISIADDASTDSSSMMISHYCDIAECDFEFYIHEKNRGYSAAKNTAIKASRGKFIVMIDADDKLTPDSIELRMNEFIKNPELDLVHGLALRWYGGSDLRGYNKKTYIHAQGRMYRRSVYERFGLYYEPLRSMSDKEYVYRLGIHPNSKLPKLIKEKKVKKPVAWYRKHDTQMHRVRKKNPKKNEQIVKIFNRRIKQLKREGITTKNTEFL